MIITFDGTSGSGKGSIASRVAKALGLKYLDTGKLYRAFAYIVQKENHIDHFATKSDEIAAKITSSILQLPELYSEDIAKVASLIARSGEVRQSLIDMQRDFAKGKQGAVLDGRDTGSVICPQADYKFYIDADVKIRAQRRYDQLREKNIIDKSLEDIMLDIKARDFSDKNRDLAPLIIPDGAFEIDNSKNSIEITVKKVLELIDN
ncbi:MAG: (d)CMP kinase [Rickettsiales bacterium]|jgi:CMP/dCMP kinase|nr:(d)CMP kinase [Rickettsiales bacterium]